MKILSRRTITYGDLSTLQGTGIYTDAKRQVRAPLMTAFDIHKGNVNYGSVRETDAEHAQIVAWYQGVCDLDESALNPNNVPKQVARHVRG